MITGGDQVRVEGKFESSFYATLGLKFLLAGNHLPRLESSVADDDGIKSRFKFLGFYNSLDESERISDYDKILYDEEGDDIFYLLVKRVQKFYDRGCKFKETENSKVLSEEFCRNSKTSVEIFVDNYCKQTVDGIVSINKLYKTYKEFCEYNGYTAMVKKDLLKYIQKLPSHPFKSKTRVQGSKNPVHVMRGIELLV